jgi:hypothetical protein
MYNGMSFDIFEGNDYSIWIVHVIPFLVLCGTSHKSSRFESYGLTKLEDPHMSSRSSKSSK